MFQLSGFCCRAGPHEPARERMASRNPEDPSTQSLRHLVPKSHASNGTSAQTRHDWVLGPSAVPLRPQQESRESQPKAESGFFDNYLSSCSS